MQTLRSIRATSLLLFVAATASAQEAPSDAAPSPDDVRTPAVATPQAMPYDPSIPLFANPRPGVFVPVLPPVESTTAPARAPAGMPKYAFVLELRIGGGGVVEGPNGGFNLQPSLFVGARLADRVHLGLAFGLNRLSLGGENLLNEDSSDTETITIFDIEPTASIDLVQARDRRVAFYVKAGVPLGALLQTDVARQLVVGYDLALGVRYLPHPMFAVGFEGGVSGLYTHPTHDDGSSVTFVYGALVGTFFAGK